MTQYPMLSLYLCALLASTPPPPVELRAGAAQPDDEVTLTITGLTLPARAEAGMYLHGKLSVPSHPLRALLLRSTDGGTRWTEVLPPEEHSEVLFVEFTGCEGRALVGWSTEGPGELTLFTSSNCGATWRRRSKLPKSVWSEWPAQMAWTDSKHGTVWLEDMNQESPPLHVIATANGGKTWSTVKQPPPVPPSGQWLEARDSSGVRWVVSSDDQTTRLERQEQGAAPQTRTLLPRYWHREGKKLVPAR